MKRSKTIAAGILSALGLAVAAAPVYAHPADGGGMQHGMAGMGAHMAAMHGTAVQGAQGAGHAHMGQGHGAGHARQGAGAQAGGCPMMSAPQGAQGENNR